MTPIDDKIDISHPRYTPALSRANETFIIIDIEMNNL